MAKLPHIQRNKIKIFEKRILGKGAFGEVCFGTADNLLPEFPGKISVAVKKLLDVEKDTRVDFLKEAHFMR